MSFAERLEMLDREIAVAVEAGLTKLRAEIEGRLQAGHEETLRQVRELRAELPAAYVPVAELEPLALPAQPPVDEPALRRAARGEGLADLHGAAVALDRARTQADILRALLGESSRFASRAAILLVRAEGMVGWGAEGFAEERVSALTLPKSHPLVDRLVEGVGTLSLSSADCADWVPSLGGEAPSEGVLIPIVLRDRVTAALYADVLGDRVLEAAALQTLTHLAALSIETLPFRERTATSTLNTAEAPVPTLVVEDGEATEVTPVTSADAAAAASPIEPTDDEASALEPIAELPAVDFEATELEVPELEVPEVEALGVEALGTEALEIELEPMLPALDLDSISIPEPEPFAWAPQNVTSAIELPTAPEVPEALDVPEEASGHETVLLRTVPPLAAVSGVGASAFADLPAEPALPEPDLPETDDGDSTHAEPLRAVPSGNEAPRTAEVRPPSGVQGPGWAFSTGRMPAVSLDDEPIHEEARRLARLLVSEIKLYNEEQVEEGRRNRDIYERLKEDIDRSRQMYEDRVDPKVVGTTDYFYQELVRILAAGDSRALGI